MSADEQMRESWDRRAERDAFYYVETAHWDGDVDTFFALASGDIAPQTALRKRQVRLAAGEPETLERFFTVFSIASRVPAAA